MPEQTPTDAPKTQPEPSETPETPEKPAVIASETENEMAALLGNVTSEMAEIAEEIEDPKWLEPLTEQIKNLTTGLETLTSKIDSMSMQVPPSASTPNPTPTPTPTPEMTPASAPAPDDTQKTAPAQNVSKSDEPKLTTQKASRKFW